MWFRSVFLRSLRDLRVPIFGWGLGMGLIMVEVMATVGTLIKTPEQRVALRTIAEAFPWNAAPVAVDTVGGYAMFKVGVFIFLVCLWPLLASTRTLRGDEDKGVLDALLAQPRSRVRVGLEKLLALWTGLFAMGLVIAITIYLGGLPFKAGFSFGDALAYGLDVTLICAVVAGFGLLVSQFTNERGPAAGWTAAFLVGSIAVDMLHRVSSGTEWISRLSPIYYFNLSKPLVPGHIDPWGYAVQLALAVVLSLAAIWLFTLRDLGAAVPLPGPLRARPRPARVTQLPSGDWSLRSVYTRALRVLAVSTAWWTLGIAAFGIYLIWIVKAMGVQISSLMGSSPQVTAVLEAIGGKGLAFNTLLLSAMFVFLPLLLMAFTVTQVSRWAGDEEEGRLDLVLATPQPRATVILGRVAAVATAVVVVSLATLLAMWVTAAATGFALDEGHLVTASLAMIPLGLLVAAIGYFASGWLTAAVDTGLISFLVAAWFFLNYLGPDLNVPDWVLRLSAFYYYGTPVAKGASAGDVLVLLVVAAVALVAAIWRFTRKDIAV